MTTFKEQPPINTILGSHFGILLHKRPLNNCELKFEKIKPFFKKKKKKKIRPVCTADRSCGQAVDKCDPNCDVCVANNFEVSISSTF